MSYTFTSLNAATSLVDGTQVDLLGFTNDLTVQVTATGNPSSVAVFLNGSLDGTNWFYSGIRADLSSSGTLGVSSSSLTPKMRHVRASVVTLSGGTAPTVTAVIHVGVVD